MESLPEARLDDLDPALTPARVRRLQISFRERTTAARSLAAAGHAS